MRYSENRPLSARPGKRTIVIVDTPMVHQMTENFLSKLFSQAYSTCSIDVHGASGLDHFVHRFTHRVTRGLLMAVGRPDGRLCCLGKCSDIHNSYFIYLIIICLLLAKSEAAVILACKQAAFVQNPDYIGDGAGPEILTVGHNPFAPNMGCCHHITLNSKTRRKFVDEYLYERLYLASVPFTQAILHNLIKTQNSENEELKSTLPYGVQHINPNVLKRAPNALFMDFVEYAKEAGVLLRTRSTVMAQGEKGDPKSVSVQSSDPGERLAFSSKLDQMTKNIQDYQKVVQQFYECRIAQLERYLSFCVIFHSMASATCKPLFKHPWNIARSQSNLRVATTSSPISSTPLEKGHMSQEVKGIAKRMYTNLRGYCSNF